MRGSFVGSVEVVRGSEGEVYVLPVPSLAADDQGVQEAIQRPVCGLLCGLTQVAPTVEGLAET